jgi:hypothetical protein
MRVLPGPTKSNQVLAWSPNGRFIAAGGNGAGIMVWDVEAATPGRRVLSAGHGGQTMKFCPATGHLYVVFQSGGVWAYDPQTGGEWRRLPAVYGVGYTGLAVFDDGRTVVLRRSRYPSSSGESGLVGYAVGPDGALTESWARPDDHAFAFTARPRTKQLFGAHLESWQAHGFEWRTAATGALVGSLVLPPGSRLARWVLAPDGEQVAWLAEHTLYLQRLTESAPRVLPSEGQFRRGLAWAPDGRTLAVGAGATVQLLDPSALVALRTFDWGTGKVRAIAFSPDGLRAAASAEGGRGWVTVFDLG